MTSKFVSIYCNIAKFVSVCLISAKLVSNYWILARLFSVILISIRLVDNFSLFNSNAFFYVYLANEASPFYFTVISLDSYGILSTSLFSSEIV